MIIEDIHKMVRELSSIERGSFTKPQIVRFHGGCKGCTQQTLRGVDFCIKCRYFCALWSLPDLNNEREDTADRTRTEILERARKSSWLNRIFHAIFIRK